MNVAWAATVASAIAVKRRADAAKSSSFAVASSISNAAMMQYDAISYMRRERKSLVS